MTASFANFVVTKRPGAERGAFRGRRYDNHLMIGGQEDMIEDTAMTMAKERGLKVEERAAV